MTTVVAALTNLLFPCYQGEALKTTHRNMVVLVKVKDLDQIETGYHKWKLDILNGNWYSQIEIVYITRKLVLFNINWFS